MKVLSVAQLETLGPLGSVWVRNTGAESLLEINGDILLSIPGNVGQQGQALKVPSTWLPIDLTTNFPKHRILESTDFRAAVRNGLLTIIDEPTAQKILREDGAKEERQRLFAVTQHIKEAGAPRTIADSNVSITRTDGFKEDEENPVSVIGPNQEITLASQAKAGLETDENGLTASFVMFADKVATEADIKALNALRTRARFNRRELKYLRDNLKNHPKTVAAVKTKLSAMSKASKSAAA